MIEVEVTADRVIVRGHAGYEQMGMDIVCSAVSVLEYVLIHSLCDLTDDKVKVKRKEGYTDIQCKDLSKEGKLLIDSFFIGITSIAVNYPDFVKVR